MFLSLSHYRATLARLLFLVAAFVVFLICSGGVRANEDAARFFRDDPYKSSAQPLRTARAAHAPLDRVARSGATNSVFALAAQRHGVPVSIALATVKIESGGRCNARGRAGELGPLQIKPATARGLGYRGPPGALASCGAGLEWGMKHLALAIRKCGHAGPHNYGLYGGCARTAYVHRVNAAARRA